MSLQKYSGIDIKLNKDSPNISYIVLANDCIISCMATKQVVEKVKYILDHYV